VLIYDIDSKREPRWTTAGPHIQKECSINLW